MDVCITCDVAVLGSGPGGYPAAIKAAQHGKKVILIEAKEIGGTCLNRGCIPSKTLISSADALLSAREAHNFGIGTGNISFDFARMDENKQKVVERMRKSLEGLIKSNKIEILRGFGVLTSARAIEVVGENNAVVEAQKIIIATGSEPKQLATFPVDGEFVHDSTSLLALKKLPKSIVIIGGGVIGCEFASLYRQLDVDVTIIEMMPALLPAECKEISNTLTRAFGKRGIIVHTAAKVEELKRIPGGVEVLLEKKLAVQAEMALIAVGRQMNTMNIGLEAAGVAVDRNSGMIAVDESMETNVPGIYAVGDIASKWWLAHVATHQGIVAANNACGKSAKMHYNAIPNVIFTNPEIASVGLSPDEAAKQGFTTSVGSCPFQVLGKAQATKQTEGFAQIVVDSATGQILGAQVVGHDASNLIAQMAQAITNELTIESITETICAHPTLSEVWLEASFAASGKPLHLPPQKG